jgi:hypothetical protein
MQLKKRHGLLLAALMFGGAAHAQTWDSPLPVNANPYTSTMNSCAYPPEWLYLDNGQFPVYAPAVVYRVVQTQILHFPPIPPIPLHPWSISLTPQAWVDMSLWVCQQKSGYFVNQCVDASDNYGGGVPEHVTVPAVRGTYYIVVTGNIEQQTPMCGPYTLTAIH